ncbi:MAG: histone deacetylase family protein [Acidimicrobiales bacterium]|nr:histone deacetylase family protein [Acidimicrobiales bacterium]
MPFTVVRSDAHRSHHCLELDDTELIPSWEHPGRADIVDAALDEAGFPTIEPHALDQALVERIHAPDYVAFLENAWTRWEAAGHDATSAMAYAWPVRRMAGGRPDAIEAQLGWYSFAADCSITAGTWPAVEASAATAQTAADLVLDGAAAAFARCRPPGHHASRDQFGGYCYLNNAAIAAQRLRDGGHDRVGVLDVDYHHGNGTQDIFWRRDDVAFASIHADPLVEFPYFLGHADETGDGPGEGFTKNLPLPHDTDADTWFTALDHALGWLDGHGVTANVVSLGVDTFIRDPISRFRLTADDFDRLGARLRDLATPTVFVMEGGYATDELGDNIRRVLTAYDG